ncbi:MAG: permease [Alphaproteobacteria bacterium]|nr:permease [Alphaproteobacteria bacterium]
MSILTTDDFESAGPTLKTRAKAAVPWLVAVLGVGYSFARPDTALAAATFAARNLAYVAPMIIVGIVLTAGITASGSMALISAAFTGREVRMMTVASLIGALTPVCGMTVLPLVAGLLAGGVPLAPIMAFWLSSPVTDPGMLAITAGTLGVTFAIGKTAAAFGAGLFGGLSVLVLTRRGGLKNPARAGVAQKLSATACEACVSESLCWTFWREPERRVAFAKTALTSARLMVIWLSGAFVAEYFLQDLLSADVLSAYLGDGNAFAVPLAALVGAPIYLDGYAALPLVRALMDGGMGSGPAMAFLIAGGIISAWAALPVLALVRTPVFLVYVVLAVISAMLAGWSFALVA